MTNREKLKAMTDEQLAKFIFDGIDGTGCCTERCNDRTCVECIVEWLQADDKPKKGDVRKFGDEYYMVVRVRENDSKLMCSDGSFMWILNDALYVYEPSDMSVDDFLKMVFRNL